MWQHRRHAARTDPRSRAINVALKFRLESELPGPIWWKMKLAQALPKTWGEPCGARPKRHCGVMTARPAGDRCYSHRQGRVANMAKGINWYYTTTLSHEFLFMKDQMDGATFSKLDTMHWRCMLPVHLCDFEAQIHQEGGKQCIAGELVPKYFLKSYTHISDGNWHVLKMPQ